MTLSTSTPVGSVIPYAGPVLPSSSGSGFPNPQSKVYQLHLEKNGWLLCDGRLLPIAKYFRLYRAIGHIYGTGKSGYFLLPDYRGRFLRGVNYDATDTCSGSKRQRDPDASGRVASAIGGWSGDQPGSLQCDALQKHKHNYDKAINGGLGDKGKNVYAADNSKAETTDPIDSSTSDPVRTATETRPKNIYVNYIIKYTHHQPDLLDIQRRSAFAEVDDLFFDF